MENQKYQQLIEFFLHDRSPSHLTARGKQSYRRRAERDYVWEEGNLLRQRKVVLPSEVAFATVRELHENQYHAQRSVLLQLVQGDYHVVQDESVVRTVLRKCQHCKESTVPYRVDGPMIHLGPEERLRLAAKLGLDLVSPEKLLKHLKLVRALVAPLRAHFIAFMLLSARNVSTMPITSPLISTLQRRSTIVFARAFGAY